MVEYSRFVETAYEWTEVWDFLCSSGGKEIYGLFIPAQCKSYIFAIDSVRTNNMPNLKTLYEQEYSVT